MLKVSLLEPVRTVQLVDSQTITGLYEQYYLPIYRYLYYRVESPQVAEDLAGDVFTRLLTSLPVLRRREVSIAAWLYRVARNLAIDHYRKMRLRRFFALEEDIPAENNEPARLVEGKLTSQALRQALNQLSEEQQEVVVLRFVAGLSIREVSSVMKRSEDAIKGLQRRGLISLRQTLREKEVRNDQHG